MSVIKKYGVILVLLIFSTSIYSQQDWNEWRTGVIYLSSGDSLKGKIIYEDGIEIIQYLSKDGNTVKSFGAFVIDSFYYYSGNIKKQYQRYYWNHNYEHHNQTPDFFQTIYNGDYRILAKENKVIVMDDWASTPLMTPTVGFPISPFPTYRERIEYDFYVYSEENTITYIPDLKKFLIEKYPNQKSQIKRWISGKNGISISKGLSELINSLGE